MVPDSSIMVRYEFIAIEHREETSDAELCSSLSPTIHSVVSTRVLVNSHTTGGAITTLACSSK